MATIADLILAQGRTRADARRRSGEIQAGMWTNLADLIGQTAHQWQVEKEQAPIRAQEQRIRDLQTTKLEREAQESADLHEMFSGETPPTVEALTKKIGPERAIAIMQGFHALHGDPQKGYDDTQKVLRDSLLGLQAMPEDVRAQYYPQFRTSLVQRGAIRQEDAPESYDPQWFQTTIGYGQTPKPVGTRQISTRNPDGSETIQIVEDKPGFSATNTPEPKRREVVVKGPGGKPVKRLVTEEELVQGVEEYREPDKPEYEWVTRGGQAIQIRKGTARPGDVPYRAGIELDADMPPAFKNALDRAVMSVPDRRRGTVVQTANRLWSEGNEAELKDVIKQAALEGENVDTKNQVRGRMATVAALQDTRQMIEELKAAGVPTGWLSGSVEDLARKLGTSSDPRYVAFQNRLMDTLISYRRAATGVAFGERESADYQRMFPNYRQTLPVNLATIEGLERAMATNDRVFWENKLGKEGAAFVGAVPAGGPVEFDGFRFPNQAAADAYKREMGK